jgi:hypothetical protein
MPQQGAMFNRDQGTAALKTIDLSGNWQFRLDPEDVGITEAWAVQQYTDSLRLPGSLPEQGIGDPPSVDSPWLGLIDRIENEEWEKPKYAPYRGVEDFKMPFWLQPPTVYLGAVWYRKELTVPEEWAGLRIVLHLERPHWETRVWVDGEQVSVCDSLSVPHEHEVSDHLTPGGHTIVIRVDNRMIVNVGKNAHSMSDHTQGNWNGIVGKIALEASGPVGMGPVTVTPCVSTRSVSVGVAIQNMAGFVGQGTLAWRIKGLEARWVAGTVPVSWDENGGHCSFDISLRDGAVLWDEFFPNLYTLHLCLAGEETCIRFGLREIDTQGTQFRLNGNPIQLRGTLDCCVFPLTGYPPMEKEPWQRILRQCKAYGLNHIRFHSWCPPEAAFAVADEEGFYLQVECASWANQGATVGDGGPLDAWLFKEAERILSAYGHHPSFVMMAYGNEPGGEHHEAWLRDWVRYWKKRDPQRAHTNAAGWPAVPENDFHNIPDPRIQPWGAGLKSRINATPPETVHDYRERVADAGIPIVSHEIGQWCAYPDFGEIDSYTGVMQAKNFELFRSFLEASGMGHQAEDFLMASGHLQLLAYKEEIEASLRTSRLGGFQLLGLSDFPGQGTALVGVLNALWQSKPYANPETFRAFCGPVVPLARFPARVFSPEDTVKVTLEVCQFGPADLKGCCVKWELVEANGGVLVAGDEIIDLAKGGLQPVGELEISLTRAACPGKLIFRMKLEGTGYSNEWDLWVFPVSDRWEPDPCMISRLDEFAVSRLEAGETLWLAADPDTVRSEVALGFSPIFWNTAWTQGQPPHTLGILCDPGNPAFNTFPTEGHSNWQWWYVVTHAACMEVPECVQPLVQVVPDWFDPKLLALVFEARVGPGRLLVSSIDFRASLVGRQMASSLLAYVKGPLFQLKQVLTVDQINLLFI